VKGVKLAVFLALAIGTSIPFALAVGMAWGFWRTYEPPPEVPILFVERVKPTPTAAPTTPKADLTAR
jgi:hypothetical protein